MSHLLNKNAVKTIMGCHVDECSYVSCNELFDKYVFIRFRDLDFNHLGSLKVKSKFIIIKPKYNFIYDVMYGNLGFHGVKSKCVKG